MISLKKILSEATINSVKKFTKKDIEKLTSYKDFIGFYKSNSKNLNKADVPRIVDEIESLKYLESDYKRGDADRDEVFVAIEEIQDLIKKSLHIKEETLTEAGMNPVKKVVNAILKKHNVQAMKTYASSVRGAHNIINGGYRWEGDWHLGFYGNVPQDVVEKVAAEMEKAGVKYVKVKKGHISADFSKTGLSEAKSDYEVYHKSYTSAIEAAREYAEKKGYEINNDDAFTKIGMGPRKPSEGKTNRFDIELSKDGKVQRKKLQIQVYGMRNSYELNAYIQ